MNIYVGNLSYETDEQRLGDLFAQHGEVTRVHLVTDRETGRPRGFGFVEMANAAEGQQAISVLNGVEESGRALSVNEAHAREERGQRSGFRR